MSNGALKLLAGAGAKGDPVYVDDVFSTFLYDGNATARNIVNGLDLSGEGGLVWIKARGAAYDHVVFDTERGANQWMRPNHTDGSSTYYSNTGLTAFNNNGFSLGTDPSGYYVNQSAGGGYVSWSFRKQPGFFDIVTYSGTGSAQNISHNLGSVPGFIWVKRYSGTEDWICYHRSLGNTSGIALNQTNAAYTNVTPFWNATTPTDSVFTVGTHDRVNTNGHTYVAYLFAHNEADFGADSDEAIIHCGTYTGNGTSSTSTQHIDLGFEPQFFIVKVTTMAGQDWFMYDTMRGLSGKADASGDMRLMPSSNTTEYQYLAGHPSPTGLQLIGNENEVNKNGETYVYMAIARPHKPASEFAATDLFDPQKYTGDGSTRVFTSLSTTPDMTINISLDVSGDANALNDRLRGSGQELYTNGTDTEYAAGSAGMQFDYIKGIEIQSYRYTNTKDYINYHFKRAPGFFDIVIYTGTGSDLTVSHNLGATPELIIVKNRNRSESWPVYHSGDSSKYYFFNGNGEAQSNNRFASVTASSFVAKGGSNDVNSTFNDSHVAYLFATVDGISKVGSYTGTGNDINVDCGFSSGARFVMVKSSSSGHWYVWDTERGIVAGSEPYYWLSSGITETAGDDYIDPLSSGFTITSSAPTELNSSGVTYIFLAIA